MEKKCCKFFSSLYDIFFLLCFVMILEKSSESNCVLSNGSCNASMSYKGGNLPVYVPQPVNLKEDISCRIYFP